MLWIAAILCFMTYGVGKDISNIYLAAIIIAIILISGLLTFYQTMQSQAIMESFKDFIPPETIVIRNGI